MTRDLDPRCLIFVALLLLAGCATAPNQATNDKRIALLEMEQSVLSQLYSLKPNVRPQIAVAAGYAVFNNANINVILASFGGGRGIVTNNVTGEKTFMRMGEVGVGLGWGVKDFRAVFVFHSPDTLENFVSSGWEFGGHIDVAAKTGDSGGALSAEAVLDEVSIYQITENGLALQATLKGTKYWKDEALNAK